MSAELSMPATVTAGQLSRQPKSMTIWGRMARTPRIVLPGAFLLLMVICAIFAPVIAPYSPSKLLDLPLLDPSRDYWLGTDDFGRDVLSRLIYGARISLGVAGVSVAFATLVGTTLGLIAAFYRGWAETLIMRFIDILLSFPTIVLAIAIVAMLGPSVRNVMIVIGIIFIPRFTRVVYGATLSTREAEFVQAARVIGARGGRIIVKAILPNVLAPVFVQISLSLGSAILVETGLSFLGLGAQPPTPSWGNMVADARDFMEQTPLLLIAPAAVIGLTILSLNMLGDGLRDTLDPRLRGSR
jgi:peptide/nickel transport system permease protein